MSTSMPTVERSWSRTDFTRGRPRDRESLSATGALPFTGNRPRGEIDSSPPCRVLMTSKIAFDMDAKLNRERLWLWPRLLSRWLRGTDVCTSGRVLDWWSFSSWTTSVFRLLSCSLSNRASSSGTLGRVPAQYKI